MRDPATRRSPGDHEVIELDGFPELVDPLLIAAFEGWNDAGDAATAAVEHLEEVWSSTPLTELDPEDYYDYQVNRPTVSVGDDGRRLVTWPTTRVSFARLPDIGRDVVLVRGIEPNMRWKSFTARDPRRLPRARRRDGGDAGRAARRLAAHPAGPGDRDVLGRGRRHLAAPRARRATRARPASSGSCRTRAPARACRPCRIWAAVPHYVAQPPCPKATLALLRHIEDLLDVPIPLGELPDDARAWERGVDELAAEDAEVADYVRSLEEAKDLTDAPEASGDAIAREFERYLRRRGDEPGPHPRP